MKSYPVLVLAVFLLVCLTAVPGCPSKPKAHVDAPAPKTGNARGLAVEALRQASSPARYREGLQLLNTNLQENARPGAKGLTAADRKFLQETVGLTAGELAEVESPTYLPADAHYLAECFLLRDAARSLEVGGASGEELARHCFGWITRHVLLYQQGDDLLPPAYVLRRGFGSGPDRALAFLALMRQRQVEGCLFVAPETPDEVALVGVFATPNDLYLFDPRLGSAVAGPDGKTATFKTVEADPKLLEPSGLDADGWRKLQVRLACPLEALSPRMRDLEASPQLQDRIAFFLDAAKLCDRVRKATGRPVEVWNPPANGDHIPNSPTRALRLLLPPDEGGTDKTNRLKQAQAGLVPVTSALLALEQIKLGTKQQLAPQALAFLIKIAVEDMFDRFYLQPHEMLLRGKSDQAIKRLQRAQDFLEDGNLSGLAANADFQRAVARWRAEANDAYARVAANDPEGPARVNKLWNDDHFIMAMLDVDAEEQPNRFEKKTLTKIVAHVAREPLSQRALWLRAVDWQDHAEREQLRAVGAPAGSDPAKAARDTWANTRSAWNKYLERTDLGPAARQQRLDAIRARLKRNDARGAVEAAHLLAGLHLDLHQHYAARLNYARPVALAGGSKSAVTEFRSVDEELAALLEKDKTGRCGLADIVDEVRQQLTPPVSPALLRSADLIRHDWEPQGNYYWMRQSIRRQIEHWEK